MFTFAIAFQNLIQSLTPNGVMECLKSHDFEKYVYILKDRECQSMKVLLNSCQFMVAR